MKKFITQKQTVLTMLIFFIAGYQNAYTYMDRGKVFANLQTGNMVLMSIHVANGDFNGAVNYIIPLVCFMIGCVIASSMQIRFAHKKESHWQSRLLVIEIICCLLACMIPHRYDVLSSSLISLNSAISLVAFSNTTDVSMPPTMMIGNLKNSIASYTEYVITKDKSSLKQANTTLFFLFVFLAGAVISGLLVNQLDQYTIALLTIPYLAALFVMK